MSLRRALAVCIGSALTLAAAGCERLANVQLTLVEPCNQRNVALNGVQTYGVSVSGTDLDESTTFTASGGPQPLEVRALVDDAVVTVRGWEGDAEADAAILSAPPKSIGRTVPLVVSAETADLQLTLPVGRVDGFGEATDVEGACQAMQNGAPVPGRHGHTATFVPGLNKVLIVGGAVFTDEGQVSGRTESYLRSAELFDPATGLFERLPDMPTTRAYHTATALPGGRVLIIGGFGIIGGVVSTLTNGLLYDPSGPADNPYSTVQFAQQRALHTATLLEDQQLVVVVGGCDGPGCRPTGVQNPGGAQGGSPTSLLYTVEIFDIAQGRAVPQPGILDEPRALHAASALEGGRVLISGGVDADGPVCSVEILQSSGANVQGLEEPGLTTFTACPSRHAQVTLGRDRVAILGGQTEAAGGVPQGPGSSQVVFWNTTVGIEALQATLLSGRAGHQAAVLDDGSILVIGGSVGVGGATAERLRPNGSVFVSAPLQGPPPPGALERAALARLPSNQVFVSGGHDSTLITSARAELYFGE